MGRKQREPTPPEGLDDPFGPPPEEYLYRYSVCGEEMLVNEAIIDVAVGVATFRGAYRVCAAVYWVTSTHGIT